MERDSWVLRLLGIRSQQQKEADEKRIQEAANEWVKGKLTMDDYNQIWHETHKKRRILFGLSGR
jgi:hypothetical protein